ncbi:CENPB DNA-binding domain-containing protein 1-like, partial [Homarus americanus]|uniref:CENPB DNA-binding domain-containing protein 1-like n=1 Tax=Homarus americanus TaxID=6706 RepID=UPI001C437BD8
PQHHQRSSTSPSCSSSKKQRKSIDLEEKQKIIRQSDGSKSVNSIARDFGMSHSTITAVKGSASLKARRLTKYREGPISNTEKMLMTWIEDQTQKLVPLSTLTITAKAKSLFEMLKQQAGADYDREFSASSGWFKRFKHRYGLHNVKRMPKRSFIHKEAKSMPGFKAFKDRVTDVGGRFIQVETFCDVA